MKKENIKLIISCILCFVISFIISLAWNYGTKQSTYELHCVVCNVFNVDGTNTVELLTGQGHIYSFDTDNRFQKNEYLMVTFDSMGTVDPTDDEIIKLEKDF